MRWDEIRNPGTTPSVFQQGTIIDPDIDFWLGSIAMDRVGNIAVGFNAMSKRDFSSVYVAGPQTVRSVGLDVGPDAPAPLGSGVQFNSFKRWGDYSSMTDRSRRTTAPSVHAGVLRVDRQLQLGDSRCVVQIRHLQARGKMNANQTSGPLFGWTQPSTRCTRSACSPASSAPPRRRRLPDRLAVDHRGDPELRERSEVRGTWLESHFRWQIRTFWFGLLWVPLHPVRHRHAGHRPPDRVAPIAIVGLWFIYRIVRGWLALSDGRAMYA